MYKLIIALCFSGLLHSCYSTQKEMPSESVINENTTRYFEEIDEVLEKDNGRFWNQSLKGPLLLIDPTSRVFVANQNTVTGDFLPYQGGYLDTLPEDINIANTAINWNGARWTMVMLPIPSERKARENLIIHELFHGIQPKIGFDNFQEQSNSHLDTYEGRLLIKLELEALLSAIQSEGNQRDRHIQNAMSINSIML